MKTVITVITIITIFMIISFPLIIPLPVSASEIIREKCKNEAALAPADHEGPNTPETIILKRRGPNSITDWSPAFTVGIGSPHRVRWWCRSTSDNTFPPGVWRIEELMIGTRCGTRTDGSLTHCRPDSNLKIDSSAWNNWMPKHSRCGKQSRRFRARLGPDHLLEIKCLP